MFLIFSVRGIGPMYSKHISVNWCGNRCLVLGLALILSPLLAIKPALSQSETSDAKQAITEQTKEQPAKESTNQETGNTSSLNRPEETKAQEKQWRIYLASDQAQFKGLDHHQVEINHGQIVIGANEPIVLHTPWSKIHLKKKAVVLCNINPTCERIVLLTDAGMKSIEVVTDKFKTSLKPGDEIVVSDHELSYEEYMGEDHIGRRRVVSHDLKPRYIVTSEVSLMQTLTRNRLLTQLAHSQNDDDQELINRIRKIVAVLTLTTSSHGNYSSGQP